MASKGLIPLESVSFLVVMLAPNAKYHTLSSCRAPMPKAAPCMAGSKLVFVCNSQYAAQRLV